jgi:hypothetical protein
MQEQFSNNLHIFIGPTLNGFDTQIENPPDTAIWHPPVKRNDINYLSQRNKPSTIIIVDGYFHNYLAVGHKEIREAIKMGWEIWGLSSMGAIRAAEMISLGMKGYGSVYKHFLADPDFKDDEVTLLHGTEKPFIPISEPLIHIRYALKHLVMNKQISIKEQKKIVRVLSSIWYGDRTLYLLKELLKKETKFNKEVNIDNFLSGFEKFRVKSIDFINFMRNKIWLNEKF